MPRTERRFIYTAIALLGALSSLGLPRELCAKSVGPFQICSTPSSEEPTHREALGDGERTVEVVNQEGSTIRIRLVQADGCPALRGTLLIDAFQTALFKVGPGTYKLRFRVERTPDVYEGREFTITERHQGVRITLKYGSGQGGGRSVTPVAKRL